MSWAIGVSEAERRAGQLSPANAQAAYDIFRENGALLLRGAFDLDRIDALRAAFEAQWGGLDADAMAARAQAPPPNPLLEVGGARYEILLRIAGAFADPNLLANPLVGRFMAPLLGGEERIKLSGFTAVVSHPGAEMQHMHRDHALLYGAPDGDGELPPHAINMAIPLIDVGAQVGPTAICLGSHRWEPDRRPEISDLSAVEFLRGDAVLIDYRTFHTGLPNTSTVARPILYMVYARQWFFDDINHAKRPSLDMRLEDLEALPDNIKPLLTRAYSQLMRARYLAAED